MPKNVKLSSDGSNGSVNSNASRLLPYVKPSTEIRKCINTLIYNVIPFIMLLIIYLEFLAM